MFGKPKETKEDEKALLEIKCLSWFESTPRATPAFTTIVATHRGAVQEDVDILIRRADFDRVKVALESVGFIHHELMGIDCFIDGPDGSPGMPFTFCTQRKKSGRNTSSHLQT